MPMLESYIDPAWNGDESFVAGLFERACTEVRRHKVTNEARIEGVAGKADTAGGEQLGPLLLPREHGGAISEVRSRWCRLQSRQ